MTKLMEWLMVLGALFSVWISLLTYKTQFGFSREHYALILYSPIIAVVIFGLYAATVVLYRVFTFNNCEEAAEELKKDIKEAKEDLLKLGFKFKEVSKQQ